MSDERHTDKTHFPKSVAKNIRAENSSTIDVFLQKSAIRNIGTDDKKFKYLFHFL